MVKTIVASRKVRLTPRRDRESQLNRCREDERQKSIHAYVETINYLLKLYATNDVVSKAAVEIVAFKKRSRTEDHQFC